VHFFWRSLAVITPILLVRVPFQGGSSALDIAIINNHIGSKMVGDSHAHELDLEEHT
jgi:hypothetical protein